MVQKDNARSAGQPGSVSWFQLNLWFWFYGVERCDLKGENTGKTVKVEGEMQTILMRMNDATAKRVEVQIEEIGRAHV